MVKFEDVKHQSTEEYFKGNQFSIDAFHKKYQAFPNETYVEALKGVCDYIASVEETDEFRQYWSERWFDEIYNDWWHPAGSIMQGARIDRNVSLSNCFSRNTEFITDKGVKSFLDFEDGDIAYVLTRCSSFKPAVVRNFGKQKVVTLNLTRNGVKKSVDVTEGHEWEVFNKNKTTKVVLTKSLTVGDKIPYVRMKNEFDLCQIGFIHGLTFGDGDYSERNDCCNITLCGDSVQFVEMFERMGYHAGPSDKNDARKIYGLPNYFKEFPDFKKINRKYIISFIIGWFAADGTVDVSGRAELYSATEENLELIAKVMQCVGLWSSNIRLVRDESPFDGNPDQKCYAMYITKDCLFDEFFQKENHKNNWDKYLSITNERCLHTPWLVESIVDNGVYEDVWCVQEPETHTFTLKDFCRTKNCTTISMGVIDKGKNWDSLEGIIKNTAYTVAKCAAYRQGLGVDASALRPARAKVYNSSNESDGAIRWLSFIDSIGYYVGQKGRIPAMLFSLSISHPDVEEFITIKSDYTKIQNANISVQNTTKFYECVLNNEDFELRFEVPEIKAGEKVYIDEHSTDIDSLKDEIGFYYLAKKSRPAEVISKKISAVYLLELIAKNMVKNAEPGIQNIDIARKYSNSDYVYDENDIYDSRIISSNACQPGWAPILTKNGIRPLQDVKIGDQIWSQDAWVTVIKKWSTGIKNVYRYRTTAGTFYGTEDHRIVSGGNRVVSKDAESIDILSGPYHSDVTIDPQDVMDGIVFGDGSVHKASNNLVHLYVGGDDQDYFDSEITNLIGRHRPGLSEFAYEITTTITADELDYTYNRSVPDRFLYADKNTVCGFLRGLFTANGGICGDRITLKSASSKLIEQVQIMLSSIGIKSYFTTNKSKMIKWKNGDYQSKESYDVNITIDRNKFYGLVGFVQKYKTENLEQLLNKIGRADKPSKVSYDIRSIDLVSEEEVFDITVDGQNHTYWTGGNNVSNCSEQYLSRESLCVLSSLNAARFSTDPKVYQGELSRIGRSVNRFLDNVNECELRYKSYATPHQRIAIEKLRRTGAGYTNLAGWLFKKNLEYGTSEGNDAVAHFTEVYNYYLYKSSIELGHEKGSFGLFNREKFEKSPFVQRMMSLGLTFDAMRNVTVSSIAPTGTLSLMFRDTVLSYGIEQAFGIYYWKRTRISGKYEYYFCVPGVVRELFAEKDCTIPMESDTIKDTWDGQFGKPIAKFIDENAERLGIRFKKSYEVTCMEKLDLMAKVMKWIDSSISVTYMLPEGSDWKDVYDFILEAYKREVKSIAAFPDRRMYGIVTYVPFKELAVKLLKEGVGIHPQNFTEDELKQLNLKDDTSIQKTDAVKRPKTLLCDIYHSKVKGKDHTVVVGLLHNDPYEIMVICDNTHIKEEKGQITKVKRGHYNLLDESGNLLWENVTDKSTENEDSLTRMTSTALRHGALIDHVTTQLEKVRGAELQGFAKCLARALKHYIKDNAKVTGMSCPECNSESLVRADGCVSCSCGWSKC